MKITALTLLLVAPLGGVASSQTVNIAPSGVASQSSLWNANGEARNAIDGNADPVYLNGSMQHTSFAPDSWWRVDFESPREMLEIRLFNRGECCGIRLSNFRVSVEVAGAEVWGADFYVGSGSVPQGGVEIIPLPAGTHGDAVQVQLLGLNNEGTGYLHMAEVEIDGREVGTTFCQSNPNSSGVVAELRAAGSVTVADNDFRLLVEGAPPQQFGLFFTSPNPGSGTLPGSGGVLCLGGPYARFNALVRETAPAGNAVGAPIDLTDIPLGNGVAVLPGDTWYFQYWFRDVTAPSNLSNGLEVTFL